jgi:3-deoxy-D-manno-octulosonic-acid transferase
MILLWNLIYLFLILLVSPYYILIKRTFSKGNYKLFDKLGMNLSFPLKKSRRIWIHAVSLGEVNLAVPIIESLKEKGEFEILVTSTTPTGLEIARKKLSDLCYVRPSPFDLTISVKRFFDNFKPNILILIEAELWPSLLTEAKKRNVPVIVANTRFGRRTEFFSRLMKFIISRIINKVDKFLVQSERTKDFLKTLGVKEEKISVVGSLKADLSLPEFSHDYCIKKREEMGFFGKKIIVAGSTAEGEEKILLKALKKVRREDLLMIIAPRHPERFKKVENLIKSFGFKYQKKSNYKRNDIQILLLDTIGELPEFYAISDCAFVGGSLVKLGGHNFIEPIFYKKPVFLGQFIYNFRELSEIFLQRGCIKILKKERDIIEMLEGIGTQAQKEMGYLAFEILQKIKGAKERTVSEILKFLNQ